MAKSKTYRIVISQCNESGVFVISQSNFPGLRLEASSLGEMGHAIQQVVPELIGNLNLDDSVDEIIVKAFVEPMAKHKPQINSTYKPGFRTRVLLEQEELALPA